MNKDKNNVSKEQVILQVAEQEFLTKGYDGARTTVIAEKAGVTHAMLHYYFRTKELLFERIFKEKMNLLISSMKMVLGESDLPIKERIRAGIISHFDFIRANPLLPRFVISEISSGRIDFELNDVKDSIENLFADFQLDLDSAAQRGEIVRINAKVLFADIFSLNVFSFISYPLTSMLLPDLFDDYDKFLDERKSEIVETIMRRIKIM